MHVRFVARPQVISDYFGVSNNIDTHNHLRQFELALEKKWVTTDPYFRIVTTVFGFNNTDAYLLSDYHGLLGSHHKRPSIVEFTSALSYQLMHYMDDGEPASYRSQQTISLESTVNTSGAVSDISSGVSGSTTGTANTEGTSRLLVDHFGNDHNLRKYDKTKNEKSGRMYHKSRDCFLCKENGIRCLSCFYCVQCNKTFCTPNHSANGHERDCYFEHVQKVNEKYEANQQYKKTFERRKRRRLAELK